MEPNVDRMQWSVVAMLAAIVVGGVVLLAFPKISGKIANSMNDTVDGVFDGKQPGWVNSNSDNDETSGGDYSGEDVVIRINTPNIKTDKFHEYMEGTGELFVVTQSGDEGDLMPTKDTLSGVVYYKDGTSETVQYNRVSKTGSYHDYKMNKNLSDIKNKIDKIQINTDTDQQLRIKHDDGDWMSSYTDTNHRISLQNIKYKPDADGIDGSTQWGSLPSYHVPYTLFKYGTPTLEEITGLAPAAYSYFSKGNIIIETSPEDIGNFTDVETSLRWLMR